MSWAEHAKSLIAYNQWANAKVLAAAAQLSEEELGRQLMGSHHSVRSTLLHTVRVQFWWLSVLNGKPERTADPDDNMPFPELRNWFDQSHAAMQAYAKGVTERQLDSQVSAFNPREKREYHWPSWQLVSHLTNHSAHHRAEAGLMLESLGHSPGDMDFVFFLREQVK
ncbi:MAG: DUF664 domain-containing protein [SAR202 cluster bacterium]|nr:DUF664 domain-containing protein [SAR202 cluster bacterium]